MLVTAKRDKNRLGNIPTALKMQLRLYNVRVFERSRSLHNYGIISKKTHFSSFFLSPLHGPKGRPERREITIASGSFGPCSGSSRFLLLPQDWEKTLIIAVNLHEREIRSDFFFRLFILRWWRKLSYRIFFFSSSTSAWRRKRSWRWTLMDRLAAHFKHDRLFIFCLLGRFIHRSLCLNCGGPKTSSYFLRQPVSTSFLEHERRHLISNSRESLEFAFKPRISKSHAQEAAEAKIGLCVWSFSQTHMQSAWKRAWQIDSDQSNRPTAANLRQNRQEIADERDADNRKNV